MLFLKDDVWVIADTVTGVGSHTVRLHWLAEDVPHSYDPDRGELRLTTAAGLFSVRILDQQARSMAGDVVRGRDDPPRGWLSRYYGEKTPAPSLVVSRAQPLPLTFVTVLSAGTVEAEVATTPGG